MKTLLLLLSLLSINQTCNQSKNIQDTVLFEYTAQSRGIFKQIIINKKTISITQERGTSPIIKDCNTVIWNRLITTLNKVNLDSISSLKAPSEKRLFDGAAIANLKITVNDTLYESVSFDHGNPPKEIADLVNELISISENIE